MQDQLNKTQIFSDYSIAFQFLYGSFAGLLNILAASVAYKLKLPVYLDMMFTISAAFFGWISGITSIAVFYLGQLCFLYADLSLIMFSMGGFTAVVFVRIFFRNKDMIHFIDVLFIIFILSIASAFEGAVFFRLSYRSFNQMEFRATKYMTYLLLRQQIPLLFASFLSRLPTNFLDKIICIPVSIFLFFGISKTSICRECLILSNEKSGTEKSIKEQR